MTLDLLGGNWKLVCLVLKMVTISLTLHVDGKVHLLAIAINNKYKNLEIEQLSFFNRRFPIENFTRYRLRFSDF